jgi:PKD repeat protein
MLMVIPSNDDKVKEGYDYDLTDDGYSVSGDALTITWGVEDADKANYIVGVVEAKKVMNAATSYDTSATIVVKETKEAKNNNVKVTPIDGASLTIDEDAIVLIDGEWAKASDIEANDVLTTLVAGELYAVAEKQLKVNSKLLQLKKI